MTDVQIIKPGDETNEEYHASGAWGSTMVNVFRKSPELAHAYRTGEVKREFSSALSFGSAFHAMFDGTFDTDFMVGPDADKRTKAWQGRLLDAKAQNKELIHPREHHIMTKMANNLMANETAKRLLADCQHEIGYRTRLRNVLVQCRCDIKGKGHIADIKTTQDVDDFRFSVKKYGYALQAGLYRQIVAKAEAGSLSEFYFIVSEKNPPYRCRVFFLTPAYCDHGWKQADEALREIGSREESGIWADTRTYETLDLKEAA